MKKILFGFYLFICLCIFLVCANAENDSNFVFSKIYLGFEGGNYEEIILPSPVTWYVTTDRYARWQAGPVSLLFNGEVNNSGNVKYIALYVNTITFPDRESKPVTITINGYLGYTGYTGPDWPQWYQAINVLPITTWTTCTVDFSGGYPPDYAPVVSCTPGAINYNAGTVWNGDIMTQIEGEAFTAINKNVTMKLIGWYYWMLGVVSTSDL